MEVFRAAVALIVRSMVLSAQAAGQPRLLLLQPAGAYTVAWIDPASGRITRAEPRRHGGGEAVFVSPGYAVDIALRVTRTAGE